MSIFDRMGSRSLPRNATYRLTQEGREKLMNYVPGNPNFAVLVALETDGASCNVDEVQRSTKMGRGQVERALLKLVESGYVQPVGKGSGGMGSGMMPEER